MWPGRASSDVSRIEAARRTGAVATLKKLAMALGAPMLVTLQR
ncbi:MAG: hypothetical protein ABIP61_06825 [Burkholderiaceae bacterium]